MSLSNQDLADVTLAHNYVLQATQLQLSDMVHLKSTIAHTLNSTCNKERFSDITVYSDSRRASFLSKTHLNFTNDRNQHIITSGQYCGRGLSGTFHTIILYINPRQKSSPCLNSV